MEEDRYNISTLSAESSVSVYSTQSTTEPPTTSMPPATTSMPPIVTSMQPTGMPPRTSSGPPIIQDNSGLSSSSLTEYITGVCIIVLILIIVISLILRQRQRRSLRNPRAGNPPMPEGSSSVHFAKEDNVNMTETCRFSSSASDNIGQTIGAKMDIIDEERLTLCESMAYIRPVASNQYISKIHDIIETYAKMTSIGVYMQTEYMTVGRFGREGGTLKFGAGGKFKLVIPQGALSAPDQLIYMYIQRTSEPNSSPKFSFSPVVECGPDGLQFVRAALLTLPHSAADTEGLDMFTQSDAAYGWHSEQSGVIDITEDTLTSELYHFSPHAVGRHTAGVKIFETTVFTKQSQLRMYIMPVSSKNLFQSMLESHHLIQDEESRLGFAKSSIWTKFNFKPGRGGMLVKVADETKPIPSIKEWSLPDEYLMELAFQGNFTCSARCQYVETTLVYKNRPQDILVQHQVKLNLPMETNLLMSQPHVRIPSPNSSMRMSDLAKPSPLTTNPPDDDREPIESTAVDESYSLCPVLMLCDFHDRLGGPCNCEPEMNTQAHVLSGYITGTPADLTLNP